MSSATKRKYVTQEVNDLILPEPPNFVARIFASRGNNLHEVELASGERCLVSMPTKFRKNIWVKRGDYVLCQPIEEGDKVKAEIFHVLYKDNVKYIKKHDLWPKEFDEPESEFSKIDENAKSKDSYSLDDDLLPSSEEENSESEGEENEMKAET